MSPYASELAAARLDALRALIDALDAAEDPAEKRRCAVAILKAPDPCDIDDSIELIDDEEPQGNQRTPSVSERDETPEDPRLSASDNPAAPPSSLPSLPPEPPAPPPSDANLVNPLAGSLPLAPIHIKLPP